MLELIDKHRRGL